MITIVTKNVCYFTRNFTSVCRKPQKLKSPDIWILGPSEVCAVSWGKIIFFIWILGLSEVCTHKQSHNNGNGDKIVNVENLVKSETATENDIEVEELFEDDKS